MNYLDLGPEEVREALDPKNFPKRHVFLIAMGGDIFICDIDLGWMVFRRPQTVTLEEWGVALRAAMGSQQYHLKISKAITDELLLKGSPEDQPDAAKVLVFERGLCPICDGKSDPENYPYCCELHRRKGQD